MRRTDAGCQLAQDVYHDLASARNTLGDVEMLFIRTPAEAYAQSPLRDELWELRGMVSMVRHALEKVTATAADLGYNETES